LNLDRRNSPESWQLLKLKKLTPEQSQSLPQRHTLSNVSFSASSFPDGRRSSGPS
jgi:hypothetical protein